MLWQRIMNGALMIAALVGLCWLDGWLAIGLPASRPVADASGAGAPLRNGFLISATWAVLAAFATRELAGLLREASYQPAVGWAVFCNVVLGLLPWFHGALRESMHDEASASLLTLAAIVLGTFIVIAGRGVGTYAHSSTHANHPDPKAMHAAAADLAMTLFAILYIGLLGSYIPRLRMESGAAWQLLYLLLVIKSCDIGAYFTGLAIGRTKLIPWLSPGKTWEGLLGGTLFAMLTAAGLAWLMASHGPWRHEPWVGYLPWPDWTRALWLGAAMALAGQAGDLLESLVKRSAGAKDSGQVVPAFGGLLDILDSPLVCIPIAYGMMLK